MFPPLTYIDWILERLEDAEYDLGSTDLEPVPSNDSVVPAALQGLDDSAPNLDLRDQIASEYDVSREQVLVTAGASHANYLAAATALDLADGQRALVERPGYEPLVATPEALGATVDRFNRPVADRYPISPDAVRQELTDETAFVTVTNRHNPSGRLTSRETLSEVAAAVAKVDAHLLVDEVYAPFTLESTADGAFGGFTAAGLPNTVTTGSLTKFHGLGGLRVGWITASREFVARAREISRYFPAVADPSIELAKRAFANTDTLSEQSRTLLADNHDRLANFVDESPLEGFVSPGSPYAFVGHDHLTGDEMTARAWDEDVLVIPGRFFDAPDRIRLGFTRPPAEIQDGVDRLSTALRST